MSNAETVLPNVGDEVRIVITPSVQSDRKYLEVGELLKVRHDETGLTVGTIRLTRKPTDAENAGGLPTDPDWIGCDVAAVLNPYDGVWRATVPVCDRAKKVWGRK